MVAKAGRLRRNRLSGNEAEDWDAFSYLFSSLFVDFIQFQKFKLGLKYYSLRLIHFLTFTDPS